MVLDVGRKVITDDVADVEPIEPEMDEVDSGSPEYLEPWCDWVRRATHMAEHALKQANIKDWAHQQRQRKWALAGHIGRRTDDRWSTTVLDWEPASKRSRGHPRTRWSDDIVAFCSDHFDLETAGDWRLLVGDRLSWNSAGDYFTNHAAQNPELE